MRVKLDENIPGRLVPRLVALGHDVHTVATEGLQGRPDPDIGRAAVAEGRLLVTQDLDFADLRRFPLGSHAGIIVVRLRDPGRNALLERVVAVFQGERIADSQGCLVIVSERKTRFLRPPRQPR